MHTGDRAERVRQELTPLLEDILQYYFPNGKVLDQKFVIGNAQGDEGKSLVISLEDGHWKDFAFDDESGAFITNLIAKRLGVSFSEALDDLEKNFSGISPSRPKKRPKEKVYLKMRGSEPLPPGSPVDATAYRDEKGDIIQYIFTYKIKGSKVFTPYTFQKTAADGERRYAKGKLNGFGDVVDFFYGLDVIGKHQNIIIVEGEKCMKALQKTLDRTQNQPYFVTTWTGGSGNCKKQSYHQFKDKNLLLWPDNDDVGKRAMDYVASQTFRIARSVKYVSLAGFKEEKDGWDCADAINTSAFRDYPSFRNFLKPHVSSVTEAVAPEEDGEGAGNVIPMNKEWKSQIKRNYSLAELGLQVNTKGGLLDKVENYEILVRILIEKGYLDIWHDEVAEGFWITNKKYERASSYNRPERLSAESLVLVMAMIEEEVPGLLKICENMLKKGIILHGSKKKSKNKYLDFFGSLPEWDGTPRVENIFINYAGASSCALNRETAKVLMHALVARALNNARTPYKFDYVVILKGAGGAGKTTFWQALAGHDFFVTKNQASMNNDNFLMTVAECLICELGEFKGATGVRMDILKSFITQEYDSFRIPYATSISKVVRRCVFVGTVDTEMSYQDPAGSRRFIVVNCGSEIDVEAVLRDREQIWAEAHLRYLNNPGFIPVLTGIAKYQARRQREKLTDFGTASDDVRDFLEKKLYQFRLENSGENGFVEFTRKDFLDGLGSVGLEERGRIWKNYRDALYSFGFSKAILKSRRGVKSRFFSIMSDELAEILGIEEGAEQVVEEQVEEKTEQQTDLNL